MDEKTLAKEELIGRFVKIVECSDMAWNGKSGVILDETKNTFLIEINSKEKRIAKKTAIFEFEHDDKKIRINGLKITYRPEDRIKKIR